MRIAWVRGVCVVFSQIYGSVFPSPPFPHSIKHLPISLFLFPDPSLLYLASFPYVGRKTDVGGTVGASFISPIGGAEGERRKEEREEGFLFGLSPVTGPLAMGQEEGKGAGGEISQQERGGEGGDKTTEEEEEWAVEILGAE